MKFATRITLFVFISFSACEKNVEEDYEIISTNCVNIETYYTDYVSPILTSNCIGCHSIENPSGDLALDNFTSVYNASKSGDIINRVNRDEGENWFMPQGGSKLSDSNLDILQTFFDMECVE
ncbi:MAG: hypothetical protein HOB40_02150 [Candidatus Marinimicrobia bacterium]|nr:hypothetical protein [Candidatus Neomarinimicrobiota bacterium]MBT3501674.1 hypothetical protein [Candidatus Neomarinimicrobiota bacterium]MBT3839852.1 hypothetical protein [Candidatus Neomarinimicrobiota bacterium]MBT3998440.1 hypothetical protein [Candidatus Neomarinimicrobiota bacterium]MBT4282240.1 hypothetical protein [Candidatus Neomarinimicrobiota bacterium]